MSGYAKIKTLLSKRKRTKRKEAVHTASFLFKGRKKFKPLRVYYPQGAAPFWVQVYDKSNLLRFY